MRRQGLRGGRQCFCKSAKFLAVRFSALEFLSLFGLATKAERSWSQMVMISLSAAVTFQLFFLPWKRKRINGEGERKKQATPPSFSPQSFAQLSCLMFLTHAMDQRNKPAVVFFLPSMIAAGRLLLRPSHENTETLPGIIPVSFSRKRRRFLWEKRRNPVNKHGLRAKEI